MRKELKKELKGKQPDPKRQRVLKTQDRTEENREKPHWDRLPDIITVKVYSYLKNSDRLAMARVCQAWNTNFKDPSLWRSREFTLGGPIAKRTMRNVARCPLMFWSCLQDVVIRCDHTIPDSFPYIRATMENLMKDLENARLCRLEIFDLKLSRLKDFRNLRNKILCCLVKMLKSQTALKHVVFENCLFFHGPGTEVLRALQDSSGQTIESLTLLNFFAALVRESEVHLLKFVLSATDVEKFTNLREIKIHYSSISNEILQLWTVNLKNKLEQITLKVWDFEENSDAITNTTWRNLTKACPQLKVELSIKDFFHDTKLVPLLAPAMPLTHLHMMSELKREQEIQLASILTIIADNFDKHLKSFKLLVPFLQDSVDNEIIRIIEGCRQLTEMSVGLPKKAALRVTNALSNDFRELQVQVENESFEISPRVESQPYQNILIAFHDRIRNSSN